ncbi:MAG: prepilin-type N-terminal cleavage/methylation domain-containing protein [Erysipelothrix sp.]|nr:prepilin-type N-terminal cleavage/methylation domain-containing protein [Erysipelothrix sp.]
MKKGFTLLEMVIVMTVIAILFLLTIPNTQNSLKVANAKGCDAQLKVVDTAILQYMLAKDVQSVSMSDLVSEGYLSERQGYCHDGSSITIVDNQATH